MSDTLRKTNVSDNSASVNVRRESPVVPSDEYLINLALANDKRAFDQLFLRYRSRILVICMKFCGGDKDQANDLCQETFIRAFDRLYQLNDRSRFFYWLSEIARNNCISHIRKERALAKMISQYEVISQPMVNNGNQWTEQEFQVIADIIQKIENSELRETVNLFYVEGKKTDEIARIQGITQTAVTTRLNRFRAKFRMHIITEIMKRRESML